MKIKILLITMMLFACSCSDMEDLFKSAGPFTTEERALAPIENIYLTTNVDVIYHYDTYCHMTVSAGSHLLEKIETVVEGNFLRIKNKNKFNWVRKFNPEIVVNVWAPTLKSIYVENASSDIRFADTLKNERFDFNSFGSIGAFYLTLQCKESYLKMHTGPSDMYVKGSNDFNYVYNAGGGKFDARDLKTNYSDVTNRGFNDLYIHADQLLYVYLTSIGNVYYSGHPAEKHLNDTGSGEIIQF